MRAGIAIGSVRGLGVSLTGKECLVARAVPVPVGAVRGPHRRARPLGLRCARLASPPLVGSKQDWCDIPASQIHTIDESLAADPAACARQCQAALAAVVGAVGKEGAGAGAGAGASPTLPPRLDLVLLGMGPDGHTASLFPEHALLSLAEPGTWVAPITDSPKPPPSRITLTYPAINGAARVAFVCGGAGKATSLASVFATTSKGEGLPSARVWPTDGSLSWFVDEAAMAEVADGAVEAFIKARSHL